MAVLYQEVEAEIQLGRKSFLAIESGGAGEPDIDRDRQKDEFSLPESKFIVICRWRNNSLFAGIFELASSALRDFFFFRNLSSVRASSACTGEGQKEKAAAAGLFVKERGDGGIY